MQMYRHKLKHGITLKLMSKEYEIYKTITRDKNNFKISYESAPVESSVSTILVSI